VFSFFGPVFPQLRWIRHRRPSGSLEITNSRYGGVSPSRGHLAPANRWPPPPNRTWGKHGKQTHRLPYLLSVMHIIKKRSATLHSQLRRTHRQFAENHRPAGQLLWHARAVSETTRNRAMASTRIANWLSRPVMESWRVEHGNAPERRRGAVIRCSDGGAVIRKKPLFFTAKKTGLEMSPDRKG
jgi:hypothetical protein